MGRFGGFGVVLFVWLEVLLRDGMSGLTFDCEGKGGEFGSALDSLGRC